MTLLLQSILVKNVRKQSKVSNCAYCGSMWFNVKPYSRGIRKWRLIRMTYSDRISLRLDTLTICSNRHIDHSTLWNMPSNIARLLLLQRNHEIIHVSSSLSHRPFRILAPVLLWQALLAAALGLTFRDDASSSCSHSTPTIRLLLILLEKFISWKSSSSMQLYS